MDAFGQRASDAAKTRPALLLLRTLAGQRRQCHASVFMHFSKGTCWMAGLSDWLLRYLAQEAAAACCGSCGHREQDTIGPRAKCVPQSVRSSHMRNNDVLFCTNRTVVFSWQLSTAQIRADVHSSVTPRSLRADAHPPPCIRTPQARLHAT